MLALPAEAILDLLEIPVAVHQASGRLRYVNPCWTRSAGPERLALADGECPFPLCGNAERELNEHLLGSPRQGAGVAPGRPWRACRGCLPGDTPLSVWVVEPGPVLLCVKPLPPELEQRLAFLEDAIQRVAETVGRVAAATGDVGEATAGYALGAFSQRQREIVGALLQGYRVPAIARRLGLSRHTVRNHLKAIFRATGVHSQAELIERFRDRGAARCTAA